MAFLDNSGDIILDAVLTDTGRMRLAKGDGTFKIVKFALADDEIDYGLYNKSHASGSAYYDLEIMQTPVLEAFTNNTSLMKHRLVSIPQTNLLYLPVLKLNEVTDAGVGGSERNANASVANGSFIVSVDDLTQKSLCKEVGNINGDDAEDGSYIRIDQGLDTTEISFKRPLQTDLIETQYIIQIDDRFGRIVSMNGEEATISFKDDDNVASYYLSLNTDSEFITTPGKLSSNASQAIKGPLGTTLKFKIISSLDLNSSEFLFTELGSSLEFDGADKDAVVETYKFIDTIVKVTGATTGRSIDVPVRFMKRT